MATIIGSLVMIAAIIGIYAYCVHQADSECGVRFKKRKEAR